MTTHLGTYPPSSTATHLPPAYRCSRCVMAAKPAGLTRQQPKKSPSAASKPAEISTSCCSSSSSSSSRGSSSYELNITRLLGTSRYDKQQPGTQLAAAAQEVPASSIKASRHQRQLLHECARTGSSTLANKQLGAESNSSIAAPIGSYLWVKLCDYWLQNQVECCQVVSITHALGSPGYVDREACAWALAHLSGKATVLQGVGSTQDRSHKEQDQLTFVGC
jgi:hypothetical protein